MKKMLLGLLMTLIFVMFSSPCYATWTLTVSKVAQAKNYLLWKVLATSDGSAMAATDLVALMPQDLKASVQGATLMVLKVSPGTGSVAPDTTIDLVFYDAQGTAIFTHAGYSASADTTGISLAEDYGAYLPVFDKFSITISDIGTAGDQVTLYFLTWVE
jgi:hypothetical protein